MFQGRLFLMTKLYCSIFWWQVHFCLIICHLPSSALASLSDQFCTLEFRYRAHQPTLSCLIPSLQHGSRTLVSHFTRNHTLLCPLFVLVLCPSLCSSGSLSADHDSADPSCRRDSPGGQIQPVTHCQWHTPVHQPVSPPTHPVISMSTLVLVEVAHIPTHCPGLVRCPNFQGVESMAFGAVKPTLYVCTQLVSWLEGVV